MTRKITSIKVLLTYVLPHPQDTSVFYEYNRLFEPTPPVQFTTQLDDVPGEVVLGLQRLDLRSFQLFLVGEAITFEFDPADAELQALKVELTIDDLDTGETFVDTAYYPVLATRRRDQAPAGILWHLALKQVDAAGQPEYHLIYARDSGPGQLSDEEMCNQTTSFFERLACALKQQFQ